MAIKNSRKKIFIIVGTVAVLLLILLVTLVWIDAGFVKVKGVVRGPAGQRMRGIELQLCTFDGPDERTVLVEGTTNLFGGFRLRLDIEEQIDEAILLVGGDGGEGRIRLTNIFEDVELEISYPVVETVVILHDNDMHFNFNHIDSFRTKVDQIRQSYDDVYLLNAGDIFVRNHKDWIDYNGQQVGKDYQWYSDRCQFMIETMNLIGYDAMTAGNHDLVLYKDYTGKALQAANFPLLAANIEITTDLLMPEVLPYVVFTTSTYREVAILGLTSNLDKKTGVELDYFETVDKYLYLADQCDIFIGLTHLGDEEEDIKLTEKYPEFDVFITGGSHIVLEKGKIINETLIVQAGGNEDRLSLEYPKYLGMIVLTLENGKIVGKDAQVINF